VNISRLLLGEPTEAFAWGDISESGVDEAVVGLLRFDRRRAAAVDCGLRIDRREEVEIVGTEGHMLVPKAFLPGTGDAEFQCFTGAEHSQTVVPGTNQSQRMVEAFGDAVHAGTPVPYPPEDAVANLAVIEALLRSMRTGRPEVIDEKG
jgi:predicted dehydrogenase